MIDLSQFMIVQIEQGYLCSLV